MNKYLRHSFLIIGTLGSLFVCSAFFTLRDEKPKFPYKKAGLTDRQAAAHLLNRFTYGPGEGDINEVLRIGMEKWFAQQLKASMPEGQLNERLNTFSSLSLSNAEVLKQYPQMNAVRRMAIRDGIHFNDSLGRGDSDYKETIRAYMNKKGLKPQQELFNQFLSQKIIRASYSENQLQEILTEFWFNHFNVSLNKTQCAEFTPAYERDVIRPNSLGKFEDLLLATAKSPAMLMYLDNFSSTGENKENPKQVSKQASTAVPNTRVPKMPSGDSSLAVKEKAKKNTAGLNENYAREVMELHTLGVDGGYTQNDVTQAAKILTGWTVFPMGDGIYGNAMKNLIDRVGEDNLRKRGFVHEGDFLFAANRHDNSEKIVLGRVFPEGGGYNEGVELLKMLAHHTATAKFITKKLAVRFVSDSPPQSLLDKMNKTFDSSGGDIKQVLLSMVNSAEFWNKDALRQKTKSPFELAISAVRSLDADISSAYPLYTWITRMGQKMYYYQAPTGFPDNGQYWINTGALLNRMNFGLALASQKIKGIKVDLVALNRNHEPESSLAALQTYSKVLMPERNLDETIGRLKPMLNDPGLVSKVENAASKNKPADLVNMTVNPDAMISDDKGVSNRQNTSSMERQKLDSAEKQAMNPSMLAQVVGIIIGSPEFQRR